MWRNRISDVIEQHKKRRVQERITTIKRRSGEIIDTSNKSSVTAKQIQASGGISRQRGGKSLFHEFKAEMQSPGSKMPHFSSLILKKSGEWGAIKKSGLNLLQQEIPENRSPSSNGDTQLIRIDIPTEFKGDYEILSVGPEDTYG